MELPDQNLESPGNKLELQGYSMELPDQNLELPGYKLELPGYSLNYQVTI